MHAKLKVAITAAAIVTAIPAASVANAGQGRGAAKGKHGASEGHVAKTKHARRCDRGRGYEARGRLAEGSELVQVAGADTARRGDDRFSGTLIVEVKKGNRRGRAEIGLTSYAVERIRARGTAEGADPLPVVGARVRLVGTVAKAACATTSPKPSPSPESTAEPSPEPEATADREHVEDEVPGDDPATWDGGDDAPGRGEDPRQGGDQDQRGDAAEGDVPADYPSAGDDGPEGTTPDSAATASAATIKLVVFAHGGRGQR